MALPWLLLLVGFVRAKRCGLALALALPFDQGTLLCV